MEILQANRHSLEQGSISVPSYTFGTIFCALRPIGGAWLPMRYLEECLASLCRLYAAYIDVYVVF